MRLEDLQKYLDFNGAGDIVLNDGKEFANYVTDAELTAFSGGVVDTANSPNANEFARFTDTNTIEGRTVAETKTDLSLNNVTNVAQEAAANKDASGGYTGKTGHDINFTNVAGTVVSKFRNSATAERRWSFQDRDGVIADDTDLALKANLSGGTFSGDINVPDEAYGAGWDGSTEVPTKNALYDKIQTLGGGGVDTANSPNANEFARFTDADTIEGRTVAETKSDLGLGTIATQNSTALSGQFVYEGLALNDNANDNKLTVRVNEDLSVDRTLEIVVNNGNRSIALAGNLTVSSTATVSGTNTGDQTSIVGITGTKSEFDAACTDGNFLYVGDVTQSTNYGQIIPVAMGYGMT